MFIIYLTIVMWKCLKQKSRKNFTAF